MRFLSQLGEFMMMGARAHAQWEIGISNTIFRERRRLVILFLLLIPILAGGIVFASEIGEIIPETLGGKKAYSPAFFIC